MNLDIKKIFDLDITESEFEEALKRLAFFSPKNSGNYVKELHEFLVMQALSILPVGQHTTQIIYNELITSLGIYKIELEEVMGALERVRQKGFVEATSSSRFTDINATFVINNEKRIELRQKVKDEKSLESKVLNDWKNKLRESYDLDNATLNIFVENLKSFAIKVLSQHSAETIQFYYMNDLALSKNVIDLVDKFESLNQSEIWGKLPENLHNIRKIEIPNFFTQNGDDRKKYIASLMHSLFIVQLTQLDPTCAAIVQSQIPGGIVYLDTNFVFRLVGLNGKSLQEASLKLAEISIKAGYQLVVSKRTQQEYKKALKKAFDNLGTGQSLNPVKAQILIDSTDDEDFYTSFWRYVKENGTYSDPSLFYEIYANLETMLLELNGNILIEDFDNEIVDDIELAKLNSKYRIFLEKEFSRKSKSEYVIEHDMYHQLLIYNLREDSNETRFTNIKYWFLTCDTTLPKYLRVTHGKEIVPFCVLSGQWLQMLKPFLEYEEDLTNIEVALLVSPLLRAYQKPPTYLISEIVNRLESFSSLAQISPSSLASLLSNQNFLTQFEKSQSNEDQKEIIEEFLITQAIEYETKLEANEEEISSLKNEFETFKNDITRKEEQKRDKLQQLANKLEERLDDTVKEHEYELKGEKHKQKIKEEELETVYEEKIQNLTLENEQEIQLQLDSQNNKFKAILGVVTVTFAFLYFFNHSILITVLIIICGILISLIIYWDIWKKRLGQIIVFVVPSVLFITQVLKFYESEVTIILAIISIIPIIKEYSSSD